MRADGEPPKGPDWSTGTFEGSERDQLRRWSALPLRRKLEALDEMCAHARRTLESRRRRGLPYVDPYSGEVIRPAAAPMSVVNEAPPAEPPSPR